MTKQDLISADLSPETVGQIRKLLLEINSMLPFLVAFSAGERLRYLKAGPEAVEASSDIANAVLDRPEHFSPASHEDAAEIRRDVALARALAPVAQAVNSLAESLADTIFAAESDAFRRATKLYAQIQTITNEVPGIDQYAAGMRAYYDRSPRKPAATE
ncbi:MAG: hypothetical protein HUU55_22815 [Myxococcales bacterium]|nr:hypothetical protein [Myxococcales bacterium]